MLLYYDKVFLPRDIEFLKDNDLIVDGKLGGLVLGPSHESIGRGVNFILNIHGEYRLRGRVEGYEYILPANANRPKLEGLHDLYESDTFIEYDVPSSITKLDCRTNHAAFYSKFLILYKWDNLEIINRNSTKKNLKYLESVRICQ